MEQKATHLKVMFHVCISSRARQSMLFFPHLIDSQGKATAVPSRLVPAQSPQILAGLLDKYVHCSYLISKSVNG